MQTMTWEQIEKDWGGLQKRHRVETAQAVARYCVGHKIEEVAERLGYERTWVRVQLDYAGIAMALGGGNTPLTGSTDNVAKEVPRLVQEFGPDVKTQVVGQGGTKVDVTGDDAEAFQPYIDHYVNEGHEPAAATRLAKAEWAAEAAVDAGVIQETKNKRDEKVNRILFPDDDVNTFALDLKSHMAKVRAAARFLDNAKINKLKTKSVCAEVEQANAAWVEQVDRIRNFHPTFDKG